MGSVCWEPVVKVVADLSFFYNFSRLANKIPQEIGVNYGDFRLFLLEDHNGARIRSIALKHMNDENEINIEKCVCKFYIIVL